MPPLWEIENRVKDSRPIEGARNNQCTGAVCASADGKCRGSSYITMDFATAAAQNRFTTCKLSLHKKIIQKM